MADKAKIILPVEFYVNRVNKMEDRDPKNKIENTYSFRFVDKKDKDMTDRTWKPTNNACITILNGMFPNIEFGKSYKITLEEI